MSELQQNLPEVPSGIDPAVLSRIIGLIDRDSESDAMSTSNGQTAVASAGNGTEASSASDTASEHISSAANQDARSTGKEPDIAEDEGARAQRSPPKSPPNHKIIARYAYPSEYRAGRRRRLSVPPTPSPPSPSAAQQTTASQSLCRRIASYIASYFEAQPDIIEYSTHEIAKRSQVRVEARIEAPSSTQNDKVVRVFAMVANGTGENGECKAKPVEIRAKHKRVREILKMEGGYVAEHKYAEDIRLAFSKLRNG